MVSLDTPDVRKIARGVVYTAILSGLAAIFNPIFQGITLLFLGSRPGVFGWKNEQWGLADLPVAGARIVGGMIGDVIMLMFEILSGVLAQASFTSPGPWDGIAFTLILVVMGVAVARFGPVLIAAIPYVGSAANALLAALPGGD